MYAPTGKRQWKSRVEIRGNENRNEREVIPRAALDVTPDVALLYGADESISNAERTRNRYSLFTGSKSLPNFNDLIPCELAPAAPLLESHVSAVVRPRAQEQMIRVGATPHIARVKYAKPVRYWTSGKLPREAMREDHSSGLSCVDTRVAFFVKALSSNPTPIWLLDEQPPELICGNVGASRHWHGWIISTHAVE